MAGGRSRAWSWTRLPGAVLALLSVIVAAYLAGRGAARERSLRASGEAPVITAAVRRGPLREVVAGSARVVPGRLTRIAAPALPSGSLPVVTDVRVRPGTLVRPGMVVATVADRPIIVLPGRLPAYRTMQLGDVGPDVARLRRALARMGSLAAPPSGQRYDPATAAAVARLYSERGFRSWPEGGTAVPLGELVFVPALPARVLSVDAEEGAILEGGTVMTLASGGPRLIGAVPSVDAGRLGSGQDATVSFPGGRILEARVERPLTGMGRTVAAEAGAATGPDSGGSGVRRVELTPLGEIPPGLLGSEGVLTIVVAEAPPSSLVVPVTAIFRSADGSAWVVVVTEGRRRRVEVSLGLAAGGEVVVVPVRRTLDVGDRVVVSTRNEG